MRPIPSLLLLTASLALGAQAAPAATKVEAPPQASPAPAQPAAPAAPASTAPTAKTAPPAKTDSAKPAPAAPIAATPAVFRASGTASTGTSPAETLDTASAEEPAALAAPAPAAVQDSLPVSAAAPKKDTVRKVEDPTVLEAPGLSKLTLGGTFQLKAFAHDLAADADKDKDLSFQMRRARFDLAGGLGERFSFEGQFLVEADARRFGSEAVYLAYRFNDLFGIKGGKIKRPFSQEALQSSKGLYTVERGVLYQDFLANTAGYSAYDLGLVFHGGFVDEDVPVTYEAGIFNGKQSSNGYSGQHYEGTDLGFKAKDAVFRITAQPFKPLKVEAAVATKAAEDTSDADDFSYHVNTGYEVGADLHLGRLRVMGEAAWGDNHKGKDANIISGTSLFFAFYGMAVWREDYSRGRASELVLKMEGLDPDFEPGSGDGAANDGVFRYTLGCNYFFTPAVSVLVDYGITQPVTKVPGEDELVHDLDAMWRMSF